MEEDKTGAGLNSFSQGVQGQWGGQDDKESEFLHHQMDPRIIYTVGLATFL
jgi:hypothetical protein